ncbi:MAG: hypothetical protein WCI95_11655 [bacterium]
MKGPTDIKGWTQKLPPPPNLKERLRFEICLIRIGSRHTGLAGRIQLAEIMRAMTLRRPSLIQIAVREMGRSPRVAYQCLSYFLGLPPSLIEADPWLHLRFGLGSDVSDVRTQIEACHRAILQCFPDAVR